MDLSIVIVNWNATALTGEALRSLREHTRGIEYEVFVVDNGSTIDRRIGDLAAQYPGVRWIRNEVNVGFSKANNIALRLSRGRFLLLLNNDTIQTHNALGDAVRYLDAQPNVGALGILHRNKDVRQSVQPSAHPFPRPWRNLLGVLGLPSRNAGAAALNPASCGTACDVDWVCGSFLMIRRKCLEQVGLLDERFFMFDEDIDWCRRAWRAGWRVRFWPGASMVHIGSATADKVADKNGPMFRSRLTYIRKNHSLPAAVCYYAAMVARLAAGTTRQTARLAIGRSSPDQWRERWARQWEFTLLRSAARGVVRRCRPKTGTAG